MHDPITARKFNSRNCLSCIRTETTACNYFLWIQLAQWCLWSGYCICSNRVLHVKLRLLLDIKLFWKLWSRSVSLTRLLNLPICECRFRSWSRVTNLLSKLTLAGNTLSPTARALGLRSQIFVKLSFCENFINWWIDSSTGTRYKMIAEPPPPTKKKTKKNKTKQKDYYFSQSGHLWGNQNRLLGSIVSSEICS